MTSKLSLTIFLATYNEVDALRKAYECVTRALVKAGISDYEICISSVTNPDGTHDGTPDLALQIAKEDSRVISLHSDHYLGLGQKFWECVDYATKDYLTMVPGDNGIREDSLVSIFSQLGNEEAVLSYLANPEARPLRLRLVSRCFVLLCNILFGLRIKYYNGPTIFPVKLLRIVPRSADNPAYMAEIVTYLIKSGVKYIQVPQVLVPTFGAGKTFRLKNALGAFHTVVLLFWRINFKRIRVDVESWRTANRSTI